MTTAKTPALITYHKPGTSPPIYVAGTFSNPPWLPHEMDHTARDGEYYFKKEVLAEPGSKIEYKFRIGDGDWWVLDENAQTATDHSGNTNHVLEVEAPKEQAQDEDSADDKPQSTLDQNTQTRQDADVPAPVSPAKAAARRLQPPAEAAAGDRSGTGTPISARVAAEVADSAELLHEGVPEREHPKASAPSSDVPEHHPPSPMSETAETAAEVADIAEALDNEEVCIPIASDHGTQWTY